MFNLTLFLIFATVCFFIVGVASILFRKDAIFTISIGAVIGANIYNINGYPFKIGSLIYGMDGVVYCIFLFCILTMYIKYGKKDMLTVLYTAMFSIFFSALLSYFGTSLINQNMTEIIWSILSYLFSIIATYIAVIIIIKLYEYLKNKNCYIYINFGICILVGNLINSIIYFGLTFLTSDSIGSDFLISLAGSAITKFISTLVCILLFYLYQTSLMKKQENNKNSIEE